jgi:hypothetical protein
MKTSRIVVIVILCIIAVSILGFFGKTCSIAQKHVYKSMEDAVISYDEYQNIYNTCKQIDLDISVVAAMPDNDASFAQFSKAQRLAALKQNMNRWVTEYNAKSAHIDKGIWKSPSLPHTLTVESFPNYINH